MEEEVLSKKLETGKFGSNFQEETASDTWETVYLPKSCEKMEVMVGCMHALWQFVYSLCLLLHWQWYWPLHYDARKCSLEILEYRWPNTSTPKSIHCLSRLQVLLESVLKTLMIQRKRLHEKRDIQRGIGGDHYFMLVVVSHASQKGKQVKEEHQK